MKLSTGQVSKLFGISKDTLRYYDNLGILKPDINKQNGYRCYSQKHLDQLNLILLTKDLDISLSDIKETIESEELCEYKELITKQESMIEEKIEELKKKHAQLKNLNKIIKTIENYENEYDFNKISIYESTYKFYGVEIKKMLEKENSIKYVEYLDENLKCMNEECYYTLYNVINNEKIIEDESILFLKEEEKNKYITKKYKDENLDLLEKIVAGKFVSVNFYGDLDELENYLVLMNIHFNKNNKFETEVFIKYDFYIPKKVDDDKYFAQIIMKLN
ncbi:MerR family transcriptional regulator [Paraclostridium bifermentans]|jgi:DNA-binding transcriptional MerR regulator|uniref:MerR family transcriptional regulator n=1 Tax=Paraclostridium bifermentans TaxID=1490 RepID=UPI0011DDB8B8|nr:MerR family transcriptional regulator [Paraclostridium bifermentans]MBS5952692.1 MerR family transcriptional regulator [Paraclostridium bifermentans]MBU5288014.1 MerR family transcriptional regulator [Paraclostridium bifermentans]MDU3334910.1 MerR family transcriptional regulator [Paraclostridium bifermentans]